ncbi:MAG TPA: antitoxin [Bacteroidales bacterium]|nr:antitoxin [Bacteroidales bacterium]
MEKLSYRNKDTDKKDTVQAGKREEENLKKEDLLNIRLSRELKKYINNIEFENLLTPSESDLTLSGFLNNKLLIVYTIRKGIPYSIFALIKDYTPFSLTDWAEYLNISGKSLTRYSQSDKFFKPIHTEKIIELAEVTNLGLEVFGDDNKFKLWLETPNYALGNQKPFELLKDSYGKEMVMGELTRIDQGILL